MCAVAEGAADLYPRLGPTHLWDTAAGAAVAAEAGCDVVGLDGRPLRYDLADGLLHPGFLVSRPRRRPRGLPPRARGQPSPGDRLLSRRLSGSAAESDETQSSGFQLSSSARISARSAGVTRTSGGRTGPAARPASPIISFMTATS